jgi:hypothetical protein
MSPMQRRSCGNSFGFSRTQTGIFAGKCQLADVLPTLPATAADWLSNLMAANIANQKTSLAIKHGLKSFSAWLPRCQVVECRGFENLEGVIDMIRHEANLPTTYDYTGGTAGATPTPNPSPQGGVE